MRTKKQISARYRLNVDLDRELAREFRKALIDEGRTLSDWVREQADRFLRKRMEDRDRE